jgi:hypothetical protein
MSNRDINGLVLKSIWGGKKANLLEVDTFSISYEFLRTNLRILRFFK